MRYDTNIIRKMIREERSKHEMTQAALGKALGVTSKQVSNYENRDVLPPLDIMLKMCEIFNCELGHLLGEQDYSGGTKLRTGIKEATGLSDQAMDAVSTIIGPQNDPFDEGASLVYYRAIMNTFLSSPHFRDLIEDLFSAYNIYHSFDNSMNRISSRYGENALKWGLNKLAEDPDCLEDDHANNLSESRREVISLIIGAYERKSSLEYRMKISRYEAMESFLHLFDDMYPLSEIERTHL